MHICHIPGTQFWPLFFYTRPLFLRVQTNQPTPHKRKDKPLGSRHSTGYTKWTLPKVQFSDIFGMVDYLELKPPGSSICWSQEGIAKSSGKASMADRELMLRQVTGKYGKMDLEKRMLLRWICHTLELSQQTIFLMDGFMVKEHTVKVWFIIQLKQPFKVDFSGRCTYILGFSPSFSIRQKGWSLLDITVLVF